jgi:hypothetical protein
VRGGICALLFTGALRNRGTEIAGRLGLFGTQHRIASRKVWAGDGLL